MVSARNPIVPAAVELFLYYTLGVWLFFLYQGHGTPPDGWWSDTLRNGQAWLIGATLGVALTIARIVIKRQLRRYELEPDVDHLVGLTCTLGEIPRELALPRAPEKHDPFSGLRLPEAVSDWYTPWRTAMLDTKVGTEAIGKKYVDLVDAVARTIAHDRSFPAALPPQPKPSDGPEGTQAPTPAVEAKATGSVWDRVETILNGWRQRAAGTMAGSPHQEASLLEKVLASGRHGGHTLLEHSFTTAWAIMQERCNWSYEQAELEWQRKQSRQAHKLVLDRMDPGYVFSPEDPLIPIIGLAHDLGKLRAWQPGPDGALREVREDHDRLSSQLLARMPEYWALNQSERRVLTSVISTYHRETCVSRSIDPDGQDDRVFTLMMLLIRADAVALAHEVKGAVEALAKSGDVASEADWRPLVWEQFRTLLIETNRIAPKHNTFRIGQKNVLNKRPLVLIHEYALRTEMQRRLPLDCLKAVNERNGDQNGLTAMLLEVLDAHGVLVKQMAGYSAKASNAIWQIDFYGRDKEREGTPIAKWSHAVIIDPIKEFPALASMQNGDSTPVVNRPVGNLNSGLLVGEAKASTGWEDDPDPSARSGTTELFPASDIPLAGTVKKAGSKSKRKEAGHSKVGDPFQTSIWNMDTADGRASAFQQGEGEVRVVAGQAVGGDSVLTGTTLTPADGNLTGPKPKPTRLRGKKRALAGADVAEPTIEHEVVKAALSIRTALQAQGVGITDADGVFRAPLDLAVAHEGATVLRKQGVLVDIAQEAYPGLRVATDDDQKMWLEIRLMV